MCIAKHPVFLFPSLLITKSSVQPNEASQDHSIERVETAADVKAQNWVAITFGKMSMSHIIKSMKQFVSHMMVSLLNIVCNTGSLDS